MILHGIAQAIAEGRRSKAHAMASGSVLFVCNRTEAFYWVCGFYDETYRFERPRAPREVEEGTWVIFWGSTRRTVRQLEKFQDPIKADPFHMLATLIGGVDRELRAAGDGGLLYQLDGRLSGVALPHKTSTPLTRLRPFSLPEWIVRENGPELLPMLDDRDFMNYELPLGS